MDFYTQKSPALPRLIYRRFLARFGNNVASAEKILQDELGKPKGADYLKFTWSLPDIWLTAIPKSLLAKLTTALDVRRAQRPSILVKSVFPHVADEFSLRTPFLEEAFDRKNIPHFSSSDHIFTMGSCFARNFSIFLNANGIPSKNFGQAEDLNSPGSNHLLLSYCSILDQALLENKLTTQLNYIWRDLPAEQFPQLLKQFLLQVRSLQQDIRQATKLIITLGNTVDYYTDENGRQVLVPKFLAMSPSEDVNVRAGVSSRMKKMNTHLRLSTTSETASYISSIYRSVRALNATCDIIFTVSPVPIDSVIGLQGTELRAIEVDCVSKSTIRAALHEATHLDERMKTDGQLHYLPSFEIVRWVAPVTGVKVFGAEDAASRHVSNEVLNAVCNFAYRGDTSSHSHVLNEEA